MWVVLLWAATAALSPGLSVETGSPDALCPDLAAARAAIEARLGVVGVQGHTGWTARYTSWHAPEQDGDFVRLEVTDPAGVRRLERDLPLAGESCSTMAHIMALVLDRYFRELGGTVETAPTPEARPEPRPRRPGVALGLAAGAMPGLGVLATAAVEWQHVDLAVQSGWSPFLPDEHVGASGQVTMTTSVPLRLALEWRGRVGRLLLHGGPELFSAFERAESQVERPGENSRLVMGPGLRAGVAWSLSRRLRLTLDGALDRVLAQGRFTIDGAEVLNLPWRAMAAIGIAFATGDEGF